MEQTPLARLLSSRREALGLRQDDVFTRLVEAGAKITTPQSVSSWETGRSNPLPAQWDPICAVYQVALADLTAAIAGRDVPAGVPDAQR